VVLDVSPKGFDQCGASFGSVIADPDNPKNMFLFYSGTRNINWFRSAIGLATSTDGLSFKKVDNNPLIEGPQKSFCHAEALTPAVVRVNNRFYMIFSGRPSGWSPRRLGVAFSDDLKGPWNILGELIKPAYPWEGRGIDNGPSIVKLDDEMILVFYSNTSSSLLRKIFRGYRIRRIGLLKIRIRGPSMHNIEVYRSQFNPLRHLNGTKGSWNESLFCPGYINLQGAHYLIPAASTYSTKRPYKQYIGITPSSDPSFSKITSPIEKLIDGPTEKNAIIPQIKSEIGLDTPSPFLKSDEEKLSIYYSVVDRADEIWKIALTTFDFQEKST